MGHMGERFQSIYDHGEPLLSTLSESCRGQKSIPNVVHFVRDTSVSKYHPKPSPTVQKRSKQGFLMPKTTRIPFLMVPNLYFSLFWLKNDFVWVWRILHTKNAPFHPLNTPLHPITPLRLFHSTSKPTCRPSRPLITPPPLFKRFLWGFGLKI